MKRKRKYQDIWELVKRKKKATIECHPIMFPTVRKGVIKEKFNDIGFKVLNDHDKFSLEISYDREKQRAVFTLKQMLGLEGVKG